MPRVTVYHLTPVRRLPLIEEVGLRTRADLSAMLGPVDVFDQRAPGTFANGKRVSGWLDLNVARRHTGIHGPGLVSYTVDPSKSLAAPASLRLAEDDPSDYWAAAKPLRDWLADAGGPPEDLEVHQNMPVRVKHVRLHAPLVSTAELAPFGPLIDAIVDQDRLAAKALMHLLIVASDADFDSAAFHAACACAWRDEPDAPGLMREVAELDPDKIVSAVLAEHQARAGEAVTTLRAALDDTREWAEQAGYEAGEGLMERSAAVLDQLERPR